jgi:hypothetical protein
MIEEFIDLDFNKLKELYIDKFNVCQGCLDLMAIIDDGTLYDYFIEEFTKNFTDEELQEIVEGK